MNPSGLLRITFVAILLTVAACSPMEAETPVATPIVQTATPWNTSTPIPTPAPSPTSSPSSTPVPPLLRVDLSSLRGRKIRFWYPWTGELDVQAIKLTQEFNQINEWGIRVEAWPMGGSSALYEALLTNLATNDLPHVVAASMDQLQALQSQSNVVLDLNTYLKAEKLGLTGAEVADFLPVFWQQDEIKGYRFGIPAQRTLHVLFYNRAWAEQLGFSKPPATPQEFQEQACAAASANLKDVTRLNDGTGGWIIDTQPLTLVAWLAAHHDPLSEVKWDFPYQFSQPSSTAAFSFLRKLSELNCAWNSRNPTPYDYFVQRQALFFSGSLQDIPAQARIQLKAGGTDRWDVIAYPAHNQAGVTVSSGASFAVLHSNTADQLAAWLFIRWISRAENQAKLALAGSGVPVSRSALTAAGAGSVPFPQIGRSYPLAEKSVPAPGHSSWRIARKILEDAAIQVLQPLQPGSRVDIPAILQQLDLTIKDLTQ